jgi:hypothetical protein
MLEDVARSLERGGFKTILRAYSIAVTNPALHATLFVHYRHVIPHGDGARIAIRDTGLASHAFFGINLHFFLQS